MDFVEKIYQIVSRFSNNFEHIQTEEGTKNALVMPFIGALGYDVFDPTEVIPEFTTDVGTKKGEKVDYAIAKDGKIIILIECKTVGVNLDKIDPAQLYRYFSVSDARFAILTNGEEYRFFSDVDSPNKMDAKPFFTFKINTFDENSIAELKKFTKSKFDLENILSTASELKYTNEIKKYLNEQITMPSDDFIKFFATHVYEGRMTQNTVEYFSKIVKDAFSQFLRERINDRLKTALDAGDNKEEDEQEASPEVDNEDGERGEIETTEEELEAYYVVKAIARKIVDIKRIALRDRKSYCGILLDDNNRKPICRLRFNYTQKYVGIFENKNEKKVPIESIDDIYSLADQIKSTILEYEQGFES